MAMKETKLNEELYAGQGLVTMLLVVDTCLLVLMNYATSYPALDPV